MWAQGSNEVLRGAPQESTAVITAQSFWDYSSILDQAVPGASAVYKATGRCFSVSAGRISFSHGLKGVARVWRLNPLAGDGCAVSKLSLDTALIGDAC